MLRLYLSGLCMGIADLIPGISGGTVAFILGIYPQLIHAVRNPLSNFRFLAVLGSGMVTAILLLAGFIHSLLQEPATRIPLYGLFLGLILGSISLCAERVHRWTAPRAFILTAAAVVTYCVTVQLQVYDGEVTDGWIALSGFFAIAAMLLPGVSGSYVIMAFGVYPALIRSISLLGSLQLQWDALRVLCFLGMGIAFGALFFVRGIEWLLRRHPLNTFATLLGCMVGALPAVWPFRSADGVIALPNLDLPSVLAFALMIGGLLSLFMVSRRLPEERTSQ